MAQYYKRVFAKKQLYKGIEFRSSLERDFAMLLDGKIVNYKGVNYYHEPVAWEYEAKEFELIPQECWVDRTERDTSVKRIKRNKKHTLQRVIYTPDFYLPQYDLLVEIKGYQFDDELFALRYRLFKHKYPTARICKITSHTQFDQLDTIFENLTIEKEFNDGN